MLFARLSCQSVQQFIEANVVGQPSDRSGRYGHGCLCPTDSFRGSVEQAQSC